MKFLLPVDSRVRNTQGFAVLDSVTRNVNYIRTQEDHPYKRQGFRGACVAEGRLFVCNSFSVKAFSIALVGGQFSANLLWQLQRPEWLVGRAANADLHTLLFDEEKRVLLLSNSFMDSVDVISLTGEYLGREFLWEMSDRVRGLVVERDPVAPDLCHLNHISMAFGQTFLTLGNLNVSGKGAVMHRESGQFVIEDLERPHDGVFFGDEFWVTETAANRLRVYRGVDGIESFSRTEGEIIDLSRYVNEESKFWCRGLHITDNRVYVGCSQFQDRKNDNPDMPPSHVLELDKYSGEVLDKFDIPGSDEIQRPVLFSLLPLED